MEINLCLNDKTKIPSFKILSSVFEREIEDSISQTTIKTKKNND